MDIHNQAVAYVISASFLKSSVPFVTIWGNAIYEYLIYIFVVKMTRKIQIYLLCHLEK